MSETTIPTKNEKLIAWVESVAKLTQPDAIRWCDGSAEEYDELCQLLVDHGTFTKLSEAKRPNSYLAWSDPGDVARVEDRTFICSENEHDAGPTNHWKAPGRDAGHPHAAVRGVDEGPHDVRRAVLDGPARLGQVPRRRAADRLALRGRLDADHDPHGPGRARRARRRRVRALPALGRRAAGRGRAGRPVALQHGEVHRPVPGDARDLVLRLGLRRQRPAGQEVLRPAHRLRHGPRRGLDGRAHADPQADLARREGQVHHRRVPVGLRQDEPRDARPDARGLDRRDASATTSPG